MNQPTFKRNVLNQMLFTALLISPCGYLTAANNTESESIDNKVLVTGSRVPRPNLAKTGAVQIIDREAIENSNFTNVGDLLQSLTVSFGSANSLTNGSASGVTTIDLRGLGTQRTLVMLNGRRLPNGGNGADNAVDLSSIPTAIIDRVEVLLDGASAIYGSDAISGVINIITRQQDDIFEVTASAGESEKSDANTKSFELVAGTVSEKASFLVSASYDEKEEVYSGNRRFSRYALNLNPDGTMGRGGSSALPWSNLRVSDANGDPIYVTRGPEFGDWRPTITDSSLAQNDLYNYQAPNLLQTPFEKYSISAFGEYNLGDRSWSDNVIFDYEAMYSHRNSTTNGAPQPLVPVWGGYDDMIYSVDNYYNQQFGPRDENGNPFDISDWRRRMVETNGRINQVVNSQFRIVMALNGEFSQDWNWELSYNYGRNENQRLKTGIFNWDAVRNSVGPTHFDNQGLLRCGATPDDIISGCVPLNIFGQPGTDSEITNEMLGYISGDWPQLQHGFNKSKTLGLHISGIATELDAGPLGIAFGLESQDISARLQTDAASIHALVTDGLGRPTGGGYSQNEAYLELNIPLFANLAAADLFELNLASRYSDYSTFGSTTNSKVGLRWVVNEKLTVRTTWSEAFRAPNVVELFQGQLPAFENGDDPCATSNPNQNCIDQGVPPGGYTETIGQIRTNTGGNPALQPESASIQTFGLVYQASNNASLTVDYFDISLENTIGNMSAITKLLECMNNGLYCDSIHRFTQGASQGVITGVDIYNENLLGSNTSGVDTEFRYALRNTKFGDWNFLANYSYLNSFEVQEPGVPMREKAGQRGRPKHKFNLGVNWVNDNLSANFNSYYLGKMKEVPTSEGGTLNDFYHTIDSVIFHNAQISYDLNDSSARVSFGINNLLDEEAPYASGGGNNADILHSPLYLGREFYTRVKFEF